MRFRSSIMLAILFPLCAVSLPAQDLPSADEVVAQMMARDAQRQLSLDGYQGMRRYLLVNDHMQKSAEMMVRVTGDPDGTKHFEVVTETGWKAAHKHVLHKMLESESETSRPEVRAQTRLSPENYEFHALGIETLGERLAYTIDIKPKRHEKYLFEGRIWVDAEDFAMVRAEGNPAKNPSFWTRSVHFVHTYQKSGAFWFPLTTESQTEARLFGTTDVTIDYFDYAPKTRKPTDNQIVSAEVLSKP